MNKIFINIYFAGIVSRETFYFLTLKSICGKIKSSVPKLIRLNKFVKIITGLKLLVMLFLKTI